MLKKLQGMPHQLADLQNYQDSCHGGYPAGVWCVQAWPALCLQKDYSLHEVVSNSEQIACYAVSCCLQNLDGNDLASLPGR